MSDKMRWRFGETNSVVAAIAADTTVEIGDLVYLNSGKILPAASVAPQSTLAATQAGLTTNFLGVAMQKSPTGSTTPIRVATSGVFEFDCVATTYEIGDLIGAYASGGSVALSNQKTVKVTAATSSIGKVFRREGAASSSVYVTIRSTLLS